MSNLKSTAFQLGLQTGVDLKNSGFDFKKASKRFKNPYEKGTEDYSDFDHGKLEGFSRIPRTWHYMAKPNSFDIVCPICSSGELEWSEWEKHIWCNVCKLDLQPEYTIFDGPIPIQLAEEIGFNFDIWDMEKKKILKFDSKTGEFNPIDKVSFKSLEAKLDTENESNFLIIPDYSSKLKSTWWIEMSSLLLSLSIRKSEINDEFLEFMNEDRIPLKSEIGKLILPEMEIIKE